MKVIDIAKELKAFIILLFTICLFFVIKEGVLLYWGILASIFLLALNFYIDFNDLNLIRPIFLLIISILNVFSLIFVIQYLLVGEIKSNLLLKVGQVFIEAGNGFVYGMWILILTSLILFLQNLGGGQKWMIRK